MLLPDRRKYTIFLDSVFVLIGGNDGRKESQRSDILYESKHW